MPLTRLLYASKSRLSPETAEREVAELVAKARHTNSELGITGALLFDGTYFVQVIEGSAAIIDQLLLKLRADPRHEGLTVAEHALVAERRFNDWALSYCGSSKFVTKNILPLFDEAKPDGQRRAAQRNIEFMHQYAET